MATPVLIPVEEYLRTSYRPDCDFIDGEVRERNLGETPHATVQSLFGAIFIANRKAWQVRSFTDCRLQTSATRFRVPDISVIKLGQAPGSILRDAPLICIEVLSPEDSLRDMRERCSDYSRLGVENIWLMDPVRRKAWFADRNGIHPLLDDAFTVPQTPIRIALAHVYAELDDLEAGR